MTETLISASEIAGILTVPITLLTIIALSDEIVLLAKRSVLPVVRRRRK